MVEFSQFTKSLFAMIHSIAEPYNVFYVLCLNQSSIVVLETFSEWIRRNFNYLSAKTNLDNRLLLHLTHTVLSNMNPIMICLLSLQIVIESIYGVDYDALTLRISSSVRTDLMYSHKSTGRYKRPFHASTDITCITCIILKKRFSNYYPIWNISYDKYSKYSSTLFEEL